MSSSAPPPPPPPRPPGRSGRPLDDDPERLERMSRALRPAPRSGEVVDQRARGRRSGIDDDEHHDGPSRADLERFGGVTQTCPHCRKELFDDADVCYHCGMAIHKGQTPRPKALLALFVVIMLVVAFLLASVAGVF